MPDPEAAAGAIAEDGIWLERLHGELRGLLAPVFAQARSRLTAFVYIGAPLGEPGDRRSCWQLAEAAGHATPRRMQALLAEHAWNWKAALAALQRFILAHLGDPGAIVVLDETAELKKGDATAGVARQHAGITGQVENCQTVVFAAYVTALAHTLFDFRLYLPSLPGRAAARHAAGWVIPPRPWPRRKRGEMTPATDLAARASLWLRAGEPASS
jgi:SRSO17 transposase